MSRYISKDLTKADVIDALKFILSKEGDLDVKENKTLNEKFRDFSSEIVGCIKDIVTLKVVKDLFSETCSDCKDCVNFLKNLFTLKYFKDFLSDLEREPLDKAKLIRYGKKTKRVLAEIVETVVFVLVAVIIIRFFICELRWIPSGSMKPTLIEGDRIVVERFSRFKSTPQRGDIMVFYPPSEKLENTPTKVMARLVGLFCKDTAYIKRVIGLPGDKLEIKMDKSGKYSVYINDKELNEPYIKSAYDFSPCTNKDVNCGPLIVPQGHYFMMGDNRGDSWDSRYWGTVPQDRFIGEAVYLFWPINRIKKLEN